MNKFKKPTVKEPEDDEIEAMLNDEAECSTTDGCEPIEPDGFCEHNYPSWLIHLGFI